MQENQSQPPMRSAPLSALRGASEPSWANEATLVKMAVKASIVVVVGLVGLVGLVE